MEIIRHKIIKNISLLTSVKIIDFLLSMVFTIYAARLLGPANFGMLGFAGSFTILFLIVADLGLHRYLNREIAVNYEKTKEDINCAFSLKMPLGILAGILIFTIINVLNYDVKTKIVVYIFGILIIFQSYLMFINGLFRGLQRVEFETHPMLFEKPLNFIFAILILKIGLGIIGLACFYLLSKIIMTAIAFLIYRKKIGLLEIKPIEFKHVVNLLRKSFSYGIFYFFGMTYIFIDIVILSILKGNVSVGIYQAAMVFAAFLLIIPDAIGEVMLPNFVNYYSTDNKKMFRDAYLLTLKVLSTISVFAAVYLISFNKKLIYAMFGTQYEASYKVLPFIALMLIFRFLAFGAGTVLTATHNQNYRTVAVIIATITNITFNLLLIPKYSYMGCAVTSLLTNIVLCSAYFIFIRRYIKESSPILFIGKLILIMVVLLAANFFIPDTFFIYKFFLSGIIFPVALYVLKIFSSDDFSILRKTLSHKLQT